jgi:predicted ester cyclase
MPRFVMPATATASAQAPDHHQVADPSDVTTAVAVASIHAMGSGSLADFESLYTEDAVNRESATEPPDTRGRGPAALYATAQWLRTAFSDLTWEIHDVAHDNDLVVVHATMSGRQTGPFVAYRPDGEVAAVFPPRGRRFAVTQSHWFRMRDGKVGEHWANRDDLGMGQQLGWNPPTPMYLLRMLLARRSASRGW